MAGVMTMARSMIMAGVMTMAGVKERIMCEGRISVCSQPLPQKGVDRVLC